MRGIAVGAQRGKSYFFQWMGAQCIWVTAWLLCVCVMCSLLLSAVCGEGVFCSPATQVGRSVQKIEKMVAGDGSLLLVGRQGGFVRGKWLDGGVGSSLGSKCGCRGLSVVCVHGLSMSVGVECWLLGI